jgi:DNA-binding transcriptional ArsR family regulator
MQRRKANVNKRGPLGQTLTIVAFLLGALSMAGGLIFLCAAVENSARLPIALALLVIGGGLAGWAGFRWRRARALSPEILDDRIISLADQHESEVTLAQVVSGLGVPDEAARTALARLEANGLCHQERREGRTFYVFPGLKESKVVRRCAYCGNEYSVREPLHKCPNCGGTLEIVKK